MRAAQIDDLFLDTGEPFDTTISYRMTAADSQTMVAWASAIQGSSYSPSALPPGVTKALPMPAGSAYRVRSCAGL